MKPVIYLGDEASVAGFRLAGIDARVATGDEAAQFAQACAEAAVVLVGGRCAARLPEATLAAARAAVQPLTLVVPLGEGWALVNDEVAQVRRLLGLAS